MLAQHIFFSISVPILSQTRHAIIKRVCARECVKHLTSGAAKRTVPRYEFSKWRRDKRQGLIGAPGFPTDELRALIGPAPGKDFLVKVFVPNG